MFVNKEYSKITVEDVCEKMKIGPFGSALHKNEISTSGDVFVLGTDNAVDNEFKVYEQRFITTEKFNKQLVVAPAYGVKGLEFDSVIIINNFSNDKYLYYVAVTRAQHELIVYE